MRARLATKGWPLDDPRDAGGGRIAVLRPVAVPSGASALSVLPVVEDVLAGRATVLPVPMDDERETSLLTTSLRAGSEIDDDVAVVVSTSGTTGTPKGAHADGVGVDGQRVGDARPPRRCRAVAARPARPSRRRPAGAGAQRRRGDHTGRRSPRDSLRRSWFQPSILSVPDDGTSRWWPRSSTSRWGTRPHLPRWRRWTPC